MSPSLPEMHVIRHREIAWTETDQHIGLTDILLTARGEHQTPLFNLRLLGRTYAHVFTGLLQGARQRCELAGFSNAAQIDPNLVEWLKSDPHQI
jgi:broad specificity phosphatase PhoE